MGSDITRQELEFGSRLSEKVGNGDVELGKLYDAARLIAVEALATNRAQAEEIEKLKEERDARAKEAAQAQARVKEVEKALRHAISVYGLMTQAMEDGPHDKEFAQWQEAIAESSPTAALEAVVQWLRKEERERAWKIADVWVRDAEINWAPEDHQKFKKAIYGHDHDAKLCEGGG